MLKETVSAGNIFAIQHKVRIVQKQQAQAQSKLTQVRAKQEALKHTESEYILSVC